MIRWMVFGVIGIVLAAAAVTFKRRDVSPTDNRARLGTEDLVALPKTKLYERAQQQGIVGRSGMTKAELVEALCHQR